jgi:hypothetical protein
MATVFKRYMVINGTGSVLCSYDGNGGTYDDTEAHNAALREASMMSTVGAVLTVEVPEIYTGEPDASEGISAARANTVRDGDGTSVV